MRHFSHLQELGYMQYFFSSEKKCKLMTFSGRRAMMIRSKGLMDFFSQEGEQGKKKNPGISHIAINK